MENYTSASAVNTTPEKTLTDSGQLWKLSLCYIPSVLLAVAGIPGALVTIRFFGRQIKKSTTATSLFITSIAVFDLFTLIVTFPVIGLSIPKFYFYNLNSDSYLVVTFMARVFKHCSNLALVLTSVERLFSVSFPHKVKNIFTKRIGIICLICICMFAFVSMLPMLLPFYNSNTYITLYKISIFTYIFFSFGCVVFCNVGLVVLLLRRWLKRRNADITTPSQVRELKLTKLIMAVTTIFIICTLPLMLIFPMKNAGIVDVSNETLLVIRPLSTLLETINYSMNAAVYFVGNMIFRAEILSICKWGKKRKVGSVDSDT